MIAVDVLPVATATVTTKADLSPVFTLASLIVRSPMMSWKK
jgi:hypothetical protein